MSSVSTSATLDQRDRGFDLLQALVERYCPLDLAVLLLRLIGDLENARHTLAEAPAHPDGDPQASELRAIFRDAAMSVPLAEFERILDGLGRDRHALQPEIRPNDPVTVKADALHGHVAELTTREDVPGAYVYLGEGRVVWLPLHVLGRTYPV